MVSLKIWTKCITKSVIVMTTHVTLLCLYFPETTNLHKEYSWKETF